MKPWRRIRNLWELSAYAIVGGKEMPKLTKDFPTVRKKMAKVIVEHKPDIFTQEKNEREAA